MREYLFHGKRVDNGEWVEGMPCSDLKGGVDAIQSNIGGGIFDIYPESFGQYTGFDEWMLDDETRNAKLYEGDIVEVWGNREIYGSNWSQYDGKVKFRGVIVFEYGEWRIEFKNKYNEAICKARGKEEYDRDVPWGDTLYRRYFSHLKDREKYRQQQLESRERCRKYGVEGQFIYNDIIKIGNVFENADLLEG
jgi:hypothetical protein